MVVVKCSGNVINYFSFGTFYVDVNPAQRSSTGPALWQQSFGTPLVLDVLAYVVEPGSVMGPAVLRATLPAVPAVCPLVPVVVPRRVCPGKGAAVAAGESSWRWLSWRRRHASNWHVSASQMAPPTWQVCKRNSLAVLVKESRAFLRGGSGSCYSTVCCGGTHTCQRPGRKPKPETQAGSRHCPARHLFKARATHGHIAKRAGEVCKVCCVPRSELICARRENTMQEGEIG